MILYTISTAVLIAILVASFLYVLYTLVKTIIVNFVYFKPERNARCSCKKCGQLFSLYELSYNNRVTWYEAHGDIKNPHCKCHDYVGYDLSGKQCIKELRLEAAK